jgi:glycosyltransferase involved in cell wall biosynthesis
VPEVSAKAAFDPPSCPERLRWIIAQEGSRQTYGIPLAFHRLGTLRMMYADIWCRFGREWLRRGTAGTRALATRFHPEIPGNIVVSFSPAAILAKTWQHFRRSCVNSGELSRTYCRFGQWYANKIRRHLERVELDPARDCFMGFNTNCLEFMDVLRKRRIFSVIDQVDPARTEEEMVLEEVERWPGWASAPDRMTDEYWRRIETEWKAADVVLVNSEWSRQALVRQGVQPEKISIVPLAIDVAANHVLEPVNPEGPLKVLWMGSIVLRKGIQYLVEAARKLARHKVEFLLAGPLGISRQAMASFPSNMKLLGRVTRDQLGAYYRQAHVFVLPTLSDGFAVTQLEAMAHGLPVIATPNCGNVVTEGVDGYIVPIRDSGALAASIAQLNADRRLLRAMSANTLVTIQKYNIPSNAVLIQAMVSQRRAALVG